MTQQSVVRQQWAHFPASVDYYTVIVLTYGTCKYS